MVAIQSAEPVFYILGILNDFFSSVVVWSCWICTIGHRSRYHNKSMGIGTDKFSKSLYFGEGVSLLFDPMSKTDKISSPIFSWGSLIFYPISKTLIFYGWGFFILMSKTDKIWSTTFFGVEEWFFSFDPVTKTDKISVPYLEWWAGGGGGVVWDI